MLDGSTRNQYLSSIIISLGTLSYGIALGWPSSTFPLLESIETPLPCGPLSPYELSFVASVLCLGGLFGLLFIGTTIDRFGRKISFILTTLPAVVSWLLILFAQNIYYLLVARFLVGIHAGGMSSTAMLYISELAEPRIRGKLDSFVFLLHYLGVIIAFILGSYLSYYTYTIIYMAVPISCLFLITFVPETPNFLIRKNEMKKAEKSLAFFRGIKKNADVQNLIYLSELKLLKEQNNLQNVSNIEFKLNWRDFVTPNARRALLIGVGLMSLNQLCGALPIITYASTIFKDYGSNLDPSISAIIVSVTQFLGSGFALILIEKYTRKLLLTISALGTGIGLTVMGIFMFLKSLHYDVGYYSAVLLCSFSFVIFILPLGLSILPFVILFEVMPEKIRGPGCSFCVLLMWIFGYITSNYYYLLSQEVGTHSCMFIFAAFCFLGAVGAMRFLTETKGKTFEEIQTLLAK